MSSRLNAFLAISLLIHLLVMGVLYDPAVQKLLRRAAPQAPPPPPPPSLTVLNHVPAPKPQPSFVNTLPSQEVAKANPDAPLEAERNTTIKSRDPAKDPNSPLPSMTGVKNNGLNYLDTPNSPQVNSTPSQPTPPQKAQPPTPPQKPMPPQPEQKVQPPAPQQPAPPNPPAVPNPVKDAPPTPARLAPPQYPNAVPILPAPPDVPKPGDKPTPTPPTPNPAQAAQPTPNPAPQAPPPSQPPQPPQPQQPPMPPQPAQPPPSSHSFAQQRTEIAGGATPNIDDPSPEAKETEAGKYKAKLYKLIGSRWYLTVEQNMTLLQIGEVRVKFFVRANGVIDQIAVSGHSGRTDILETISLKSVEKASGVMEPFSDSMKAQFGEGFWDEITFTIY